MNKTVGGISQPSKNFEIYLKIRKQSLLAKANKIIFGLYSIQLPSSFNDKTNLFSLQKSTKKFDQKIGRLTKEIENKVRIIASNDTDDKVDTLKKINRLTKNLEKLQIVLKILPRNKEQVENKNFNQYIKNANVVVKDLEKVQQLLNDIDNTSNALKFLK